MFHDDVIVTHLIMVNTHKKQCPYIREEGFCHAKQSQVSAQCPIPLRYINHRRSKCHTPKYIKQTKCIPNQANGKYFT